MAYTQPKRADYVIGKKTGKVFEVKPKPFTGPKVNAFQVALDKVKNKYA